MLGAAPDPEVQQLIFFWIWHLSGIIAKPNPQTSPRSCHLTIKSDVHFHFNRKKDDSMNYVPLFFCSVTAIFIFILFFWGNFPDCSLWGFLQIGMTLLLIEYFNQWSYNKRDTPLCLPCSKLQQAAVISVYQAGYWCWPWQHCATRWAGSQTSRQKKKKNKLG